MCTVEMISQVTRLIQLKDNNKHGFAGISIIISKPVHVAEIQIHSSTDYGNFYSLYLAPHCYTTADNIRSGEYHCSSDNTIEEQLRHMPFGRGTTDCLGKDTE